MVARKQCISLIWSDMPGLVMHIMISVIAGCCWQEIYWINGSYLLSWTHHCERFTVTTITWLIVTEKICVANDNGYVLLVEIKITCHWVCKKNNTTGSCSEAETAYPSESPVCISVFLRVRVAQFVVFGVVFGRLIFVLLRFTDSDYPFDVFKLFV